MATRPDSRIPVAVLGATGAVGQRLVSLLDGHPQFVLAEVAASERSAGKTLRRGDALDPPGRRPGGGARPRRDGRWTRTSPRPSSSRASTRPSPTRSSRCRPGAASSSSRTRSRSGCSPDVPLVIPEVNADHLALLDGQPTRASGGGIVTNPNCSVVGLAMALAPLHRAFGIEARRRHDAAGAVGRGLPGRPVARRARERHPVHRRRGGEDRARAEEDPRPPRGRARRGRGLPDLRLRQPRAGARRPHGVGLPRSSRRRRPSPTCSAALEALHGRAAAAEAAVGAGAARSSSATSATGRSPSATSRRATG